MLTKLFVSIVLLALANARDLYRVKRAPIADMLTVVCRRQPDLKFCTSQGSESPSPPVLVEVVTVVNVPQVVEVVNVPKVAVEPVQVVQVAPKVSTVNVETVPVGHPQASEVPAQDRDAICKQYVYHFWYYCGNVEDHPKDMQKRPLEPGKKWFPTVPPTVPPTQQPCTYDCEAPHCTDECICTHYWPEMESTCIKANSFAMFAGTTCQMYFENCEQFGFTFDYEAYVKNAADKQRSRGLPVENKDDKHNRKHYSQFWQNPESQHTDWMNGDVRVGQDWGVPALGMGGSLGEAGVNFPGAGQFLGIDDHAWE